MIRIVSPRVTHVHGRTKCHIHAITNYKSEKTILLGYFFIFYFITI